jgi:hypothetical protein
MLPLRTAQGSRPFLVRVGSAAGLAPLARVQPALYPQVARELGNPTTVAEP